MRGEGVQGVLTLFCSGAAQVCHDDRVVELKEQLEVEEEDGDRQEQEVEVAKGRNESKRVRHGWNGMTCECARNMSHEVCGVIIKLWNKDARAISMHVHHASVEVPTSSLVSCLVSCMLYASFQLLFVMMLQVVAHLFS